MKLVPIAVAAASIFSVLPAFSATTFDFETDTSFSSVNLASPNGIVANGALLALANDAPPADPFFTNAPGNVVAFVAGILPGEKADISISPLIGGFVNAVTLTYSTIAAANVYARDAGGAVIGTFALAPTASGAFDAWTTTTYFFSGFANSIDFSDTLQIVGGEPTSVTAFDSVTVSAVPLPAALLLFPFGAAALGAAARRKKAA